MFGKMVGLRVADVTHEALQKDDHEYSLVVMHLELNPFTPEIAGELDEYMKSMLYTRQDATANGKLRSASFNLSKLPQSFTMVMAPDQKKPTLDIEEARIGVFKCNRSKKSTAWTLKFTVTFNPASKEQLAAAVDARLKTRYFEFEDSQADLFSEPKPKTERAAGMTAGAGETATAH